MSVLDRVCFVGLYTYERRLFGYDKIITEEKKYDGLRLKQMYKSYPENYTDSHYFFIPSLFFIQVLWTWKYVVGAEKENFLSSHLFSI